MQRLELSSQGGGVLASAAEVLLAGGVAIFPTDTVYGMGALPRYSEALKRIYKLKDRPLGMPLPLLLSDNLLKSELLARSKAKVCAHLQQRFGQVRSP